MFGRIIEGVAIVVLSAIVLNVISDRLEKANDEMRKKRENINRDCRK